jgi:hypothetical protein
MIRINKNITPIDPDQERGILRETPYHPDNQNQISEELR